MHFQFPLRIVSSRLWYLKYRTNGKQSRPGLGADLNQGDVIGIMTGNPTERL